MKEIITDNFELSNLDMLFNALLPQRLDYYDLKNKQKGVTQMSCKRYVSELDFLETDYLLRPSFKLLVDYS